MNLNVLAVCMRAYLLSSFLFSRLVLFSDFLFLQFNSPLFCYTFFALSVFIFQGVRATAFWFCPSLLLTNCYEVMTLRLYDSITSYIFII